MARVRWINFFQHSAKGSTWDKHKYIKRLDGTYYYPDNYEGGRHLPDGKKKESSENGEEKEDKNDPKEIEDALYDRLKGSEEDLDKVLRGSFDKVLRSQLGIDWTTLPKEDVDRMQRSIINRLKDRTDEQKAKDQEDAKKESFTEKDFDNLAKEVIERKFGDGAQRKELLGEYYEEVQSRVNKIMRSSTGSKKVSEATAEDVNKVDSAADKVSKKKSSNSSSKKKSVDMERVFGVYRRKEQ